MKKLCLAAPLLFCLTACAPFSRSPNSTQPTFVTLGVPLDSEEGKVKLAVLEHMSETIYKSYAEVRFVPLSEPEIQQVHARFLHSLRPGTQAEITRSGAYDKSTKEHGLAIEIRGAQLNGDEADVLAGCVQRDGESRFNVRVVKVDGTWRVHDFTPEAKPEITAPSPGFYNNPQVPRRRF